MRLLFLLLYVSYIQIQKRRSNNFHGLASIKAKSILRLKIKQTQIVTMCVWVNNVAQLQFKIVANAKWVTFMEYLVFSRKKVLGYQQIFDINTLHFQPIYRDLHGIFHFLASTSLEIHVFFLKFYLLTFTVPPEIFY